MKKSIFKRTVASATGILLAATQLGVLATSAADAITIDASYLTDVPVVVNPISGQLEYTEGSWYDLLYTAYMGAEDMDQEISLASAKNTVKDLLADYVSEDTLTAVLAAVSNANVKGSQGVYTITATVGECGPAIFDSVAEYIGADKATPIVSINPDQMVDENGNPIDTNVSNLANYNKAALSVSGTVTVTIDMTAENTIAYAAAFTAEDGNVYTIDTISNYVTGKLTAIDAIIKQAGVVGYSDDILAIGTKLAAKKAEVEAVSVTADNFDAVYAAYYAVLPEKAAEKAPATLAEAIVNEKVNEKFNKAVAKINANQDVAVVDLTVADLAGIAAGAYDINVTANGLAADAAFSIADDQNAELLAAFQEYYGEDLEKLNTLKAYFTEEYDLTNGNTYSIASVTSHKEITLSVTDSALTYNIIRVIDSVVLNEKEPDVQPDPVYTYTLNVNALPADGGIYWSEETEAFNLFDVDLSLTVVKDGVEVETISNMGQYFAPDAAAPADIAYTAYGAYDVNIALTAEGLAELSALLTAKGYDASTLDDSGIEAGLVAGTFSVTLVTRGDADLNEKIDTMDALDALKIYVYDSVMDWTEERIIAAVGTPAEDFDAAYYAADVNADGTMTSSDSLDILRYYVFDAILEKPLTWVEQVGSEVTHTQAQHFNPTVVLEDNTQG